MNLTPHDHVLLILFFVVVAAAAVVVDAVTAAAAAAAVVVVVVVVVVPAAAGVLAVHVQFSQVSGHLRNFSAKVGYHHYYCLSHTDCYHYLDCSDAVVMVLSKHHHLLMKLFSSHGDDVLGC